jgi:class 3 adenylate cyclase
MNARGQENQEGDRGSLEQVLSSAQAIEDYFRQKERRREFTVVMFADLVGSTEYKARRAWIPGLLKVITHNNTIVRLVDANRGRLVKLLGDGVMARWDGPSRRAATNAINCAIKIQETFSERNRAISDPVEQFHSKIGIAIGVTADLFHSDPHGPTVDLAARLQAHAKADEIIISTALVGAADTTKFRSGFGELLAWTPDKYVRYLDPITVKGFDKPQGIVSILWTPEPPSGPQADATNRSTSARVVEPTFDVSRLGPAAARLVAKLRAAGGCAPVKTLEKELAIGRDELLELASDLSQRQIGGLNEHLDEIYLRPPFSSWLDRQGPSV